MDVYKWESNASEVDLFLHGFNQSQYVELFEQQNITLDVLLSLTSDDIRAIGVEDDNDCLCIAQRIQQFRNKSKNYTEEKLDLTFSKEDALTLCTNTLKQLSLLDAALAYTRLRMKKEGIRNTLANKLTTAKVIEILCKEAESQNDILMRRMKSLHPKLETKTQRLLNKKKVGIVTVISTAVAVIILAVYKNSNI
ncbi:hypothetical protein LSTR_LSTR000554 [Laodelphax striatellus]|uniref:SAM domain-containing protein n=1 Tax=Laodelphax striatellus TaxID=195883 RepID=A0A482XCB9_LAOST|nr:hypothetical protein LSTR_LSTR000554 [Laodelphax striatellus]